MEYLTPIKTESPAFTLPDNSTPETTHPTKGTENTSDIESSRAADGSNLVRDRGVRALRKHSNA